MYKSKQNVMWKDSVAGFVKNGLVNCVKLHDQLIKGTYKIDKYTIFNVYEPKKKENRKHQNQRQSVSTLTV
jgi:hypothetical protein